MDNNNFEQQFIHNVQQTTAGPPVPTPQQPTTSKLPLVIALALACIVIVESIALLITLTNYFSITSPEQNSDQVIAAEDYQTNNSYLYDQDENLISVKTNCTDDKGVSYRFDTNNTVSIYDESNSLVKSEEYSVTHNNLITFSSDPNHVFYFDGFTLADGLHVYSCEVTTTDK